MNESTNITILSGSSPTFYIAVTLSAAIASTFIPCFVISILFHCKENSQEEDWANDEKYRLHFKHVSWTLVSLFIYALDVSTDIVSTWNYWTDGNPENFWLTLTFTILPTVPNIVTMMFSIFHPNTKLNKKWILIISTLLLSPIIQFFVLSASLTIRPDSTQKTSLNNLALLGNVLGVVEAMFESTPQIIVQIYIHLKSTVDEELSTRCFWYLSITASILGVAKSIYIFKHNVIRWNDVKLLGKFVSYFSSVAVIGPRIVLLGMFVYAAPRILCVIFFVVHAVLCIVIASIAGCKNMTGEIGTCNVKKASEIVVFLLGSFANIFIFCEYKSLRNIEERCTKIIRVTFYALHYIENLFFLVFYAPLTDYLCIFLPIGIGGFISHAILYFIYKYYKSRNNNAKNNGYDKIQNNGSDGVQNNGYGAVQNNGYGAVQNDGHDGVQNNRGDREGLLSSSNKLVTLATLNTSYDH